MTAAQQMQRLDELATRAHSLAADIAALTKAAPKSHHLAIARTNAEDTRLRLAAAMEEAQNAPSATKGS